MVNGNVAYQIHGQKDDVAVNEKPVKWCSVTLSDVITRGKRLEASVFDVESKQAYHAVKSGKYETTNLIGQDSFVERAHYGARLKREYVESTHENSIGFIGSSEMLDIDPKPVKYMIDSERVKELHVKKNTVLVSRSGTIGNISFVNDTLSHLLISEHAMRLECRYAPGYVYAYLKTHTGQALIRSNIYGAVISQIEPEHLATIPIPKAPKSIIDKIDALVIRSYDLRDESNSLRKQATRMLVKELQLPEIHQFGQTEDDANTFTVKLSNLQGRLDASYHVPIATKIVDHLYKMAEEVTTIGDPRISQNVILPGRFKRVYVDEGNGFVFIGGKQIHELNPSNKKYLSKAKHDKQISNELSISENTTLITRSGTIGKVALVPRHWENWVASEHIIRVVPANKDVAGYLNVFLASDYGYQLINRFTYGAVVDEIDANHVRQIAIPLLKNHDIQQEINDLALQANQKRYEAYLLEQEALRLMNHDVIFAR